MLKIYVAGPMSGIPEHNFPAFDKRAAILKLLGFKVITPPDISRANPMNGVESDGSITDETYKRYMKLDLLELLCCNAIMLLPGWEDSKGACFEKDVASKCGIPSFETIEELWDFNAKTTS